MQIETFEVTEIGSDGTLDCGAESVALIERLELEGQKRLIANDGQQVVPYRRMTAEELFVYRMLLPQRIEVAKYESGPIPLRVLQVLAHARELGLFGRIEVWFPEEPREPDPLLAGIVGRNEAWLLARWGAELAPFAELLVRASGRWRERLHLALANAAKHARADLEMLEGLPAATLLDCRMPQYDGLERPSYQRPSWADFS